MGDSLQGRTGTPAQDPEAMFEVMDPEIFGQKGTETGGLLRRKDVLSGGHYGRLRKNQGGEGVQQLEDCTWGHLGSMELKGQLLLS